VKSTWSSSGWFDLKSLADLFLAVYTRQPHIGATIQFKTVQTSWVPPWKLAGKEPPMRQIRIPLSFALPFLLLLPSCGGEPADEPAETVTAEAAQGITPSDVPEAQAAYEESGELWSSSWSESVAKLLEAIELDPDFLDAHGLMANRYAWIYQYGDRADSIIQNAWTYAQNATELNPDALFSLSAMGTYYYRIEKDYGKAMEYFSKGSELFPDNGHFLNMTAHVARRQGDWDRALEILRHADELVPSLGTVTAILENHRYNRRWEEAMATAQEIAERYPESTTGPSYLAWIPFYQTGNTETVRAYNATRPTGLTVNRWSVAVLDRDYQRALDVMDASETEVFTGQNGQTPRDAYRGIALRSLGREAEAMEAFESAKATMEAMLPELDHDWRVHAGLGWVNALLGNRDEAIRVSERAIEILPPEKDALAGPPNVANLAEVYAILGDAEPAVEQIEYLLSIPGGMNRGWLRVGPVWDPIRDHPAFQALLEG